MNTMNPDNVHFCNTYSYLNIKKFYHNYKTITFVTHKLKNHCTDDISIHLENNFPLVTFSVMLLFLLAVNRLLLSLFFSIDSH